jgi:hypothetical protein
MRAAFRLSSAEEGEKRIEQIARQLEHDYSSAARSFDATEADIGVQRMFSRHRENGLRFRAEFFNILNFPQDQKTGTACKSETCDDGRFA